TGPGTYDVLTWSGSRSGIGSIYIIDNSTTDWAMTGAESTGKYTITVVAGFQEGGNYGTGNIVIPIGGTLGTVSGTAVVSAANTTTISGITGGTVTLNASGNTIGAVSNGTLNLKAGGNTVDTISGGAVTVEGSGSTFAGLTGGSLNVKANSTITSLTSGTLSVDSGVDADVKGGTSTATITGAGNLVKSGSDKLTLSGTSSDYTGATKVAGGELEVTSVSALGSTSGVTLGTSSSSTAATFTYSGSAATISQDITALSTSQSGNTVQNSGTGLLTLGGTLTKDGTVLTLAGGSNGIKVTGEIVGTSSNSDLVVSSGTVTVSSSNSYNGPTFIQGGATLVADNASATGSGIVDVANGARLQVGTASNILTLTTGGFALHNGSVIRVYVDHVDVTGLTGYNRDGYTHFDLSNTAGTAYSTLLTSGTVDVTNVTAGGITIEVYGANYNTPGLLTKPFYDFKFLEFASTNLTGLGNGLNIADLFTIDTTNLRYATGDSYVRAGYNYNYLDDLNLIKMYSVQNGNNTILMMSIPEPSTYGLGLGALALAAVAIRRRKQKKASI
ncbi:MAG: PEP-CTERM sorting domain-containing protein, partial [Microbacteriaceae bacterium]|nr:PEP-CTERM sorting domain-containing protein [Microbacteriaceae bacterium]